MEINAINFQELRKFESFKSISEMDESIYEYIDYLRNEVASSVIDVLLCLGRASLRCIGISFMKQATIANATGYSRKTINKAMKELEEFGVVDSVRTKTTKGGRPSVKVVRILPFCLERLQQRVTSRETNEVNADKGLTLIDEFEPFVTESPKQEKNIISDKKSIIQKVSQLSTNIELDGKLKNIVRYLAIKVGDRVKNGLQIESFSSYCEKVLSNEIRRASAIDLAAKRRKEKKEAERNRFEAFVLKHYGERFEDLGSFAQGEALRQFREILKPKRGRSVPFYNWLEAVVSKVL
ncbi:hypothetical protein ACFRCQ_27860 [Cytobacillus firmus]|uniref:hypothetical protein n=1 Tax=Cytobacillus firmus TaxID=1399 RepID=UPI0036A8EEAE